MAIHPKDIERAMQKLPVYRVSSTKDAEIRRALTKPTLFNSLIFIYMKRLASFALVLALFFGGVYYLRGTTVQTPDSTEVASEAGTYAEHLQNARAALIKLQAVLKGQSPYAFVMSAYAQEEEVVTEEVATDETTTEEASEESTVDETAVTELTEEIIEELAAAVDAAEEVEATTEVQEALAEISDVQDEAVETLDEATSVVVEEETVATVTAALETTVEQQEAVEEVAAEVETAAEAGEETVDVEVEETTDFATKREEIKAQFTERATAQLEAAKAALETMIANGATEEEIARYEARLAKAEEALESGKVGRAFGLSRSIEAKQKHIEVRAKRTEREAAAAETFLENSDEKLAELIASGATEEEIAAFEAKVEKVQAALDSGDAKLLRKAKIEARKEAAKAKFEQRLEGLSDDEKEELREKAEERREEFREKREEKQEEMKEKREERREEAQENRQEVRAAVEAAETPEEKREILQEAREEVKENREERREEVRENLQERREAIRERAEDRRPAR